MFDLYIRYFRNLTQTECSTVGSPKSTKQISVMVYNLHYINTRITIWSNRDVKYKSQM